MYKTQTQIKLGATRRPEPKESHTSSVHHSRSGGGGGEKFTLNIFQGVKSSSDPVQDDMTYRRSVRLVITMDIIFSTFLLVAYLISLVSGSAHQSSSTKGGSSSKGDDGNLENKDGSSSPGIGASLTKKQRETLAVLVWMGLFAVCILQLLVAGGTLGGTYERDGRKTIRNCKIWMVSTCLVVILLVIQLVAVVFLGRRDTHSFYVKIVLLIAEIAFRSTGLVIVSRFIKELMVEFCSDDEVDMGDRYYYEKLCPSPNPSMVETHHV